MVHEGTFAAFQPASHESITYTANTSCDYEYPQLLAGFFRGGNRNNIEVLAMFGDIESGSLRK
jgi:hypothetical protein